MVARLWWKEARQFRSIWLFLLFVALAAQWVAPRVGGDWLREGVLCQFAMIWVGLYALTVGSAAFAGEKELGTLRLLDTLGASRRLVWRGKASFGLATSAALGLVLLAAAVVATDRVPARSQPERAILAAVLWTPVVLEALAWGWFWSAVMRTALNAAVLAAACLGVSLTTYLVAFDRSDPVEDLLAAAPWHLGLAVLLTLLSAWVLNRPPLRDRDGVFSGLRPDPTILWEGTSTGGGAFLTGPAEPPRRDPIAPAFRMVWLVARQGMGVWALLLAIGVGIPSFLSLGGRGFQPLPTILFSVLAATLAGVQVFHPETRDRSHRFLAHHGLRPGWVWFLKLGSWLLGLSALWLSLVILAVAAPPVGPSPTNLAGPSFPAVMIGPSLAAVLVGLGLGQLCGMIFPRGITAVVVGLVVVAIVSLGAGLLVHAELVDPPILLATALAPFVVGWGWSRDWLHDRPAPGRWVRLGLWSAGVGSVLFGLHAGTRAWGVRDVGPPPTPLAWSRPVDGPNAAEPYREAVAALRFTDLVPQMVDNRFGQGLDLPDAAADEWLALNRETLQIVRRATMMPDCQFLAPEARTLLRGTDLPPSGELARLLAVAARRRQAKGDLDGAWSDVLGLFRMARHHALGRTLHEVVLALAIEQKGLAVAMEWAAAPGQTPARLEGAIASYRGLPTIQQPLETLRAEATLTDRFLDQPNALLREGQARIGIGAGDSLGRLLTDLIATPWESERARRIARMYFQVEAGLTEREPWQRSSQSIEVTHLLRLSPLARLVVPNLGGYRVMNDRNEVARRVLVVMLRLRIWALGHGGRFPETLEELSGDAIVGQPLDPFTNHRFHYVPNAPRSAPTLGAALPWSGLSPVRPSVAPASSSCLIVSAGPDRRLEFGKPLAPSDPHVDRLRGGIDDLVFPFPP